MKKTYYYLVLIGLISVNYMFSQGTSCGTAEPFCAGGAGLTFANTTGVPSPGTISCLFTAPNPAWFYLQIGVGGNINMTISQNSSNGTGLDVDYAAWGPFGSAAAGCSAISGGQAPGVVPGTPATQTTGCSYSSAATEILDIPNAQVGAFYMVMITNFSNQVGQISLTQTNSGVPGAGSTDCNIVCPLSLADQVICPGGQAILTATIDNATSYEWSSSVSGTLPDTNQHIVVTQPGTYTVVVNKPGCVANATASATVSFSSPPPINPPVNLNQCDNIPNFDLNNSIANIFNGTGLNPADYELSFHHSYNDAINVNNPISPAGAYPGTDGETIYLSVTDNSPTSSGCIYAFSFTLSSPHCGVHPSPVPNLVLCDDPSNDGFATFDLTPQIPIAYGANNPANYTITFYTSLSDANAGTGAISPINSFTNTVNPQTIYIRLEDNSNAATYGTESFQLSVNSFANAGADGSTSICETSATPINLFTLITGEQPGGTWTQTTGTGGTFNAVSGVFTPAFGATTSTFTYTVTGTAPCVNDTSLATVNITAQPSAGSDGATTICENSAAVIDLFGLITGEQTGGTWVRTTGTGGIFNAAAGTFTPAIGATTSTFTYTVTGVAPCINDSSIARVNINAQPNAGTDGNTTVCETSLAVINLFNLITGEQAGGTWTRTTGTGGTFNAAAGTFTPVVGATTSTFTYTLTGTAPCVDVSSVATVNINPQPNAGTDGSTIVCDTSTTPINLFSLITGEQPGGVWTQNTGTGGTFNAAAGTYTPAVGATSATFTYTLTGIAPCINDTSTAIITVNPQPVAGNDGGITICENSPATIILSSLITGQQPGGTWTRTTGTGGAFNAVAGTFTPGIGVTTSTFTYTLTGTAPCINDASVATVTVNPVPTATISGTASVCLNSASPQITLTGADGTAPYTFTYSINNVPQPTVQTSTGNNYLISVPTSPQGTYTYTLMNVRDAGSTTCSQAQSGSATVTVVVPPVINTPTDYVVCDDSLNNDGIYCFDLTVKNPEVSSDPNVIITYHETPTDAQTGSNPLSSPYCNIDSGHQTLYVRAYNQGAPDCYSTTSFNLVINPIPLPNPVITDYELCDYNNPGDQTEIFDLNTKIPEISNGQAGVTVTFYATLADAQNQTNVLPNLYSNTSNPQQIWLNIKSDATGCNTTGSFHLIVNPLPVVTQPPTIPECSNGIVPNAVFNLTINQGVVTGNVLGLTVTYYHNLADAQIPINPITAPQTYYGTDGEIIVIRVANNTTGCYATTTQLLTVTQGPVALTPQPLEYCDPNNDGIGVFNLEDASNEITGTPPGSPLPPGVSVTYHETPDDAFIGSNPLTSPYTNIQQWSQIIYVRVFYTLTGCANYVQLKLIVNPTPVATTPQPYQLCDYTGDVHYETFDLNTRIPEVLGSLDAGLNTVSFYTTQGDAQAGTNAIQFPGHFINTIPDSQPVYVRVQTNATGCFDVVVLQLIVNPLPTAVQPAYPPYTLCDYNNPGDGYEVFDLGSQTAAILNNQTGMAVTFYPSLGDAQNGTGGITNLMYRNQIQYVQTLGIRITNNITGCYVISTMDIRVEPLPVLIPPTGPYVVCDGNQDGFAAFDLTTLLPDLLNGITTYTVNFYETQTDANSGANPIDTSVPYHNIDPFTQTIWVGAVNNAPPHCSSVITIQLEADPSPVAPVNLVYAPLCDNDNNPQDGMMLVDLTQQTPMVLAQEPLPATSYKVEYYNSLAGAQQGTAAIINNTSYPVQNGQTIWVRVENLATGCYNIGSFQLQVNSPLLLTTPAPLGLCDDDANINDRYHTFDLTVRNGEITQNLGSGYTVTYYPSIGDAMNGTNEITTPGAYTNISPAVQSLGVVVTTPAHCRSITTLDIRVLPIPVPQTPPALPAKCDDTNPGDMVEVFDLTANAAYISNNDPTLTLHYFASASDEMANINEIMNPSAASVGHDVTIRVENTMVDYQGSHCYRVVTQALMVNPLPVVASGVLHQECEDPASNTGVEVFDLTQDQAALVAGNTVTPGVTYSVTYYQDAALTQPINNPAAYSNTGNPQTIYVVVTNSQTGCRSQGGSYTIRVNPKPVLAYTMLPFNSCDLDGVNDGQMFYYNNTAGLADYVNTILGPTQTAPDFIVEFYKDDFVAATTGDSTHAIQNLGTYQVSTGTYYVRVENTLTGCYNLASFAVLIEKLAEPVITSNTGSHIACVNLGSTTLNNTLVLDSGITAPNYTFEWSLGGSVIPGETSGTLNVTTIDQAQLTYGVKAISNNPPLQGCPSDEVYFTVVRSGPAANVTYTVSNAFSDVQVITVSNDGYGTYEYSLDDGPRQTGPVFEGVTLGDHTIHVWDASDPNYSCGVISIGEVQIIDYPHYFTPNGDGINDTWNVSGLKGQGGARIYIFDRYGKLLKQISSAGNGWDGTFNGHMMPSDDYWFTVDYIENATAKEFKAHFAMKR